MCKAERIYVHYENSQSVTHQGNRASVDPYIRKGFYIKDSRNGFWVLVKAARVDVTVDCGVNGQYTFNMKDDICMHYGKLRISESLTERFKKDFANGIIEVWADQTGYAIK